MRIAVIGARGFIGRRVVDALAAAGVEMVIDPDVDLEDPATFARLDGAAAVIVAASPGRGAALARHCLARGLRMIDCSSHAPTTRALLELAGCAGPGAVVVGAGMFPGISNLLAARDPGARAVAVELDLLSGAGAGTIDSVATALAARAVRVERIAELGGRPALAIESSDAAIAAALGPRPLELWITTRQRWLARLLPAAAWLGRRRLLGRLVASVAGFAMKLVRARLLRDRRSPIRIYTAGADVRLAFEARDGMEATARSIAWAAVTAGRRDLRGVVSFAELAGGAIADPSRPPSRRWPDSARPESGCT